MEFGPVIKNPVLDINKLVRQGTMLNQSVQNVEGDSTADQATVDLMARKDPVIHEISVGMSGEELTQYTVSGTPPLSLPNSLGKPLKAWSVDVLPNQEGTGDPSPDNVRPIHGTDKLTITTAGKNLFNWDRPQGTPNPASAYASPRIMDTEHLYVGMTRNNYYGVQSISSYSVNNGTISVTVTAGGYGIGYPVSVIPNQVYSASFTNVSNAKISVGFYDADWNFVSHIDNVTYFTVPQNALYVILVITPIALSEGHSTAIAKDIQLEFGSTASDFAPYVAPSQTVLTLPQTVYTGTIGSEGGESRWGEVDLGTLTWYYAESWGSSPSNFYAIVEGIKKIDATATPNMLVSIYKSVKATDMYLSSYTNFIAQNGDGVRISDARFTDKDTFKAAMQGIKLYYELATPTTFAVPSPTIPTPTGTATTWATAEDGIVDGMEVTYYKSE